MSEPASLFDFSNVRCQAMVVENLRNPSGEVSASRMPVNACDRCVPQQKDKLLQRSSRGPFRFSLIGKQEFLSSGDFHIEILLLVPDMRGQSRQERKPSQSSFGLLRSR